jgi:hypothetical protein
MAVLSDFAQRDDKRRGGREEGKRHDHEYQIVHSCFPMLEGNGRKVMRRRRTPRVQNCSGLMSA